MFGVLSLFKIMAQLALEKLKSQQTAEQEEAWANAAQEPLAAQSKT